MIFDKLENSALYASANPRFAKAFDYLKTTDFSTVEPGKYPIDGDLIYAAVSEYDSKEIENCKLEAHLNYIDIQYIVSGEEQMGVCMLEGQVPSIPYNTEKDCVFYKEPVSLVKVEAGMIAVFFPHDLHQPCIQVNGPAKVKKVVVKVKL